MIDEHATEADAPAEPVAAAPPLVLHPRGGVVIVALLLLTLGLVLVPLAMFLAGTPAG